MIIIVAIVLAFTFNISVFKEFLVKYEKYSLSLCLLAYMILGVTPIPTEPITLFIIAWKGPVDAILMATIGNTLAAVIEFYIGGSIGNIADFEKKKEKLPFHLGKLPLNSPLFLFLGRMIPGFGPKFVSLASGIYQVPLFTYLWTTLSANLIGAAVFCLGGWGILRIFIH